MAASTNICLVGRSEVVVALVVPSTPQFGTRRFIAESSIWRGSPGSIPGRLGTGLGAAAHAAAISLTWSARMPQRSYIWIESHVPLGVWRIRRINALTKYERLNDDF